MHDLHLSRLIPIVAACSLLVSAPGCGGKKDDEDDNDDEVPDKEETLEDFCAVLQKCEPDEFDATYDDVDDCATEGSQNYDAYIDAYGENCGAAFLKFADCWSKSWSPACDEDAFYEDCFGELVGVSVDCSL